MDAETRFPPSMGPVDGMFWRLEHERTLRSTTLAVAILDAAPDRAALRAALHRVCRRIPRLRQRVVELPAGLSTPRWRPDPDFELDYHLRWISAPRDSGEQGLLDLAASMTMQAFDRTRPLWEFVVVEELADGRAALLQKLHHAVGDGAAGVALMEALYDVERDPPPVEEDDRLIEADAAHDAPVEDEGALTLAAEALAGELAALPRAAGRSLARGLAALRSPFESARRAAEELRAVAGIMRSGPGPLSPIMRGRSSRCRYAVLRLPGAGLAAAARAQGCTFNDAFLTALTGGLARYHEEHGASVPSLRAAIPINTRDPDGGPAVGNRLAIARFSVPLRERDPRKRMREIHRRVAEQRTPASLGAFEVVAALVNRAPPALVLPLVLGEMRKSDFVATALPGPTLPLHLAGSRVESLSTFGPTAGAALNATLFGYADQTSVGLTLDPVAVPDREVLVECVRQGFDEVLKLA